MRTEKYLSFCLSILFFSAGAYLLECAVGRPGRYAEELVLIGALLSAFAMAMLGWSLKLRTRARAMHKHMRGQ